MRNTGLAAAAVASGQAISLGPDYAKATSEDRSALSEYESYDVEEASPEIDEAARGKAVVTAPASGTRLPREALIQPVPRRRHSPVPAMQNQTVSARRSPKWSQPILALAGQKAYQSSFPLRATRSLPQCSQGNVVRYFRKEPVLPSTGLSRP
jgi:hypothetical protein